MHLISKSGCSSPERCEEEKVFIKKKIANVAGLHGYSSFPPLFLLIWMIEHRSVEDIKLLVQAGAAVNQTRPDGVAAIWLAAQV